MPTNPRLEEYVAPPPAPGGVPSVTHYDYDLDGMPTAVTRPDGSVVTMGYDTAGRMQSLDLPGAGSSGMTFGYSPATGKLASVSGPYGVDLAYAYTGGS